MGATWVEAAAWDAVTEPGVPYTIVAAANCNNTPTALTLSSLSTPGGTGLYSGVAEVINQNRNVSVVAGRLQDMLPGYGTAAYRFPPTKWSGGGVVTGHNGILNPSYEYAANVGSPDGDYLSSPAEQYNGASFMTDSRTSVDGGHSLRLIAPTGGAGVAG